MNATIAAATERYLAAAHRGVAWLLARQHDDGSVGPPEVEADVYHKAGYAFAVTGHIDAAHRLYDWIRRHDLQPGGALRHYDQGLALYKTNWILQGAHRLARFDLSAPVSAYVATRQAPCGGFFQNEQELGYIEPVCTAWAAVSMLYTGRLDAALQAADCLAAMLDQQPNPRRFYYRMTPDGRLIVDGPLTAFVDGERPQQAYYCPGIALLFAARLHLATGRPEHLSLAQAIFEATLRLHDDAYRYTTAAKGGVGTAILYGLTGDPRALDAALSLADYLVDEQSAEGWWANPHADNLIIRLDHTAEFIVFLSEIAGNLAGSMGSGQ